MLSGPEILCQVKLGNIEIEPFEESCLGPNSYDVHLGPNLIEFLQLRKAGWDLTEPIPDSHIRRFQLDARGTYLKRRVAYLGHIVERIHCHGFVPWLDGRSTSGRYFLQCHTTAGRGDDGWSGYFTLELMALYRPLRLYPGLPIAQVSFFPVDGERQPYSGRYSNQDTPALPKPLPKVQTTAYLDKLKKQVKDHPATPECPDPECLICGIRDCPFGEPLHYHHDGCPACCRQE